jgi:CheY-like chemotaxis protein
MPLMDGVELTETILKNHLDLKAPIIAITANAMNTDKSIYLQAVMKGFISKTVQLKKIGSTLDYYFK